MILVSSDLLLVLYQRLNYGIFFFFLISKRFLFYLFDDNAEFFIEII